MIERVEYNGYASVYMHFDSNFGQVMNIKQVDSLVGWDQAHWRGKREKNGEWSELSNDNDRESLNSIAPQTMHPLKIFNWFLFCQNRQPDYRLTACAQYNHNP